MEVFFLQKKIQFLNSKNMLREIKRTRKKYLVRVRARVSKRWAIYLGCLCWCHRRRGATEAGRKAAPAFMYLRPPRRASRAHICAQPKVLRRSGVFSGGLFFNAHEHWCARYCLVLHASPATKTQSTHTTRSLSSAIYQKSFSKPLCAPWHLLTYAHPGEKREAGGQKHQQKEKLSHASAKSQWNLQISEKLILYFISR